MDLVRDCLDKQVVDQHARPIGKVDGLVIEVRERQQPQVTFIEIGAVPRWRRIHPALASVSRKINRWLKLGRSEADRIPWSKVVATGIEVIAGVEAEKQPALRWELWLRHKVVSKIPGAY